VKYLVTQVSVQEVIAYDAAEAIRRARLYAEWETVSLEAERLEPAEQNS
jgi:hypothetical protein